MNRIGMIGLAAAALGLGLAGGSSGSDYRRRDFTLDELEAQSVHRMMARAARRRRQSERERQAAAQRLADRRAAEIEAARPKSRQELRAAARENAKDPHRWDHKRRR